jgi:hypothetical protein
LRKPLLGLPRAIFFRGEGEKMRNRVFRGGSWGRAGFQSGLRAQINARGDRCKKKIS